MSASYFWKIEEAVGGGMYITLEGIFASREGAELAMARGKSNRNMRVVLYRTGDWSGGPVRADDTDES